MVEKKFYLESNSPLQEIGMRAQVVSFLIANGIKEGNALNDHNNQKKVIVAVRADEIRKIEEIKSLLVEHLNKLSNKSEFCYNGFPTDIHASQLYELNNPHPVMTLQLTDLANSLMLEQTSKGVGAMKYLAQTLKPLHELPEILKTLSAKLK